MTRESPIEQATLPSRTALLVLLLVFLCAGLLLIPYPGVQNDEALFANGIYTPQTQVEHITLFGLPVPIMIMTYVGALKAWIYTPIFSVWAPSPYSLRIPVLLLGALAVWLYSRYLALISGRRAALIGALLLATDVTFLLTTTFDWGPVALQHTLLIGGLVLVLRFYRGKSMLALGSGFFLFGLALWDKALFLWMLSGIVVAAALLYHREIRSVLTVKRCGFAALAFLLGSLPFVGYNLANGFQTFRGKQYSFSIFSYKAEIMTRSLTGTALAGYLIDFDTPAPVPEHAEGIEAVSLGIADLAGHPQRGPLPWLLGLAILTAPLSFRSGRGRLLLFFAIGFAIAWFQMLITEGAGASAHHTILLWPHVIGFVAVSLASVMDSMPSRTVWVAWLLVAVATLANILLINWHLAGFVRFGPGPAWTTASYSLAEAVNRTKPAVIFTADWGMGDALRMLLRGEIPIHNAVEPYHLTELDDAERQAILSRLNAEAAVYINYVDGRDVFPNAKRLFQECAEEHGFTQELIEVVRDSRGRDVFELYRFQRSSVGP